MMQHADGTGGAPPRDEPEDRPFAPRERAAEDTADKAEPEKARTEIEAGDVADDLADFA